MHVQEQWLQQIRFHPVTAAVLLVLLGDLLFWAMPLGLSLVIYAWVILGCVACQVGRLPRAAATVLFLGSLPTLDHVQPLSFLILIVGLVTAIAWTRNNGRKSPVALAARIAASLPSAAIRDFRRWCRSRVSGGLRNGATDLLKAWAFPLGGALVLTSLLAEANPVIHHALSQLGEFEADWLQIAGRVTFWTGLAMLVWPLLSEPHQTPLKIAAPGLAISLPRGALLRALSLFNVVLVVQIGLDATIVLGDSALPEGMSYSEYARRGAFPLLAATMLGGAFALFARQQLDESRWLRPLLFLWLAQNVLMVVGAGYRLAMYVDAYGLTYLRLHAGIWMGMVACLLTLTAIQIWKRLPARWLTLRAAAFGFVVLYMACFVNFADLIARQNIARGGEIDWQYLRFELPPTARASVLEGLCEAGSCPDFFPQAREIEDWREWGFRRWRVERRMETLAVMEQP